MTFITFMTFMATLTFSSYLLIRNLHSTRFSFCDIRNGPELSLINHGRVFFLSISYHKFLLS